MDLYVAKTHKKKGIRRPGGTPRPGEVQKVFFGEEMDREWSPPKQPNENFSSHRIVLGGKPE